MIILRSLCLLHHASSLDNSTRVVMVDDVSTADFVSTAVRRPSRVDAMLCFGAIFVEAEEPVRFSKRRQSSAIDRLHDQDFCVTTRMGMVFCDVHFGFNNDSGGIHEPRLPRPHLWIRSRIPGPWIRAPHPQIRILLPDNRTGNNTTSGFITTTDPTGDIASPLTGTTIPLGILLLFRYL